MYLFVVSFLFKDPSAEPHPVLKAYNNIEVGLLHVVVIQ